MVGKSPAASELGRINDMRWGVTVSVFFTVTSFSKHEILTVGWDQAERPA